MLSSSVECKYRTWYWLCQRTGEVKPFNCGSWACPVHAPSVAYGWAVKVAWACPERMITLTGLPQGRERASRAFSHLSQAIRRGGFGFEYIRFLEVGRQGGLHYHLAQKGDYIPQPWLSQQAQANGLGRVVDIRACYGQGPAWYLSKYITKEAAPPGWRKVSYSRGWPMPAPHQPNEDWELVKSWT